MERGNTVKFATGKLQNESGNTSSVTNEEDIEIASEPFETTCTIVENKSQKKPSKSILDDVKLFHTFIYICTFSKKLINFWFVHGCMNFRKSTSINEVRLGYGV